ncbi:LysR family transcriptional regulator [Acerihabitans sp. TG2]|uniref:LysR family transcriptional regulator n=1 Tax=Acerihabitans sp. TG2 TaxID=3096008 RepID=UPI002B23894F|nr:LysR family transcriptional regulator [Acerihabitans sp. TG2]MEA9392841.1 LysR family transcriptional regulator [Acerihabitans sp. TG2]
MNINESDFRGIDLNLLVTFLVLYREKSVSVAAAKLFLGQPAVSSALGRLRELFGDRLFVRTAQGMQPTSRADYLAQRLAPLLGQMQDTLFHSPDFDPHQSRRLFTLGMADWVEICLMPPLLARLHAAAPHMRFNTLATTPYQDRELLEQNQLDMALSVTTESAPWLQRSVLRTEAFVVLWHPQQLAHPAPLSLDDYLACDHLLVTYRSRAHSAIDDLLVQRGRSRQIRYTTSHFSALPGILQRVPVLTTVPSVLASAWQTHYGLCASPLPFDLPSFELSLLWHLRLDGDPARRWLAQQIAAVLSLSC